MNPPGFRDFWIFVRRPPPEGAPRVWWSCTGDFFENRGQLPEDVTFALVVGIMQNHRQMKAMSLYFHLAVVLQDSDH